MMKKQKQLRLKPIILGLTSVFYAVNTANAVLINEDFTKGQTTQQWYMPLPGAGYATTNNMACLTANTATAVGGANIANGANSTGPGTAGSPARCADGAQGGATDADGNGALRLTNNANWQVGGIVSNFDFPTNDGVDITFTSYSYGGNGADGMAFFLLDADRPATLGANGGALGYSCSNMNAMYNGVDGAYLGIGMDEWGNFLNGRFDANNDGRGDNDYDVNGGTVWGGAFNPNLEGLGDNTNSGPDVNRDGARPFANPRAGNAMTRRGGDGTDFKNTIGIRGKGIVSYNYLRNQWLRDIYAAKGWVMDNAKLTAFQNQMFPNPNQSQTAKNNVQSICRTGKFTIPAQFLPAGQADLELTDNDPDLKLRLWNYRYIENGWKALPTTIWDNVATRTAATPMQYRIRIDKAGRGSVWYSRNGGEFQPVMQDVDLVNINGPLPERFRFGFMGATGGSNNKHEVTCFKASSVTESEGNISVNNPDSKIVEDTQIYMTFYNNYFWTGQVQAKNLLITNGTASIAPQATWDSACLLDGGTFDADVGTCTATGQTGLTRRDYTTRNMVTWNGNSGTTLTWNNLTNDQKASLKHDGEDDARGEARLNYLRGDRSNEASNATVVNGFRARRSVLGDIINSSPLWVGYPNKDYSTVNPNFTDKVTGATGAEASATQSYAAYRASHMNRSNVVYSGSNDGFLHGFRAGSHTAAGKVTLATSDGYELMAYMPSSVLRRISKVTTNGGATNYAQDFTHEQYAHNYYNDAPPGSGDVFYGGEWHTWLMSGLGAGGSTVYALDITDPDNFTATNVIGEWSNGDAPIWDNLHNSYGTPVFGRFHDGNWGAVFGNGWCNTKDEENGNCTASDGEAGIYVMSINQTTGTPSFVFIGTGERGTRENPNGIAYVTPFDVDGDNIYDYAYAGDIKGNVWRFDLKANTANGWTSVAPNKIFETRSNPVNTGQQPISSRVVVSQNRMIGADPIINFGTGIRINGYLGGDDTYAQGIQSIYGLRDTTAVAGTPMPLVTYEQLQEQAVTGNTLTTNEIDWGSKKGWYMNLGSTTRSDGTIAYEQVIYDITLQANRYVLVNTYIDAKSATLTCDTTTQTGYTYPLYTETGAGLKNFYDGLSTGEAIRKQYNLSGSAYVLTLTINGKTYLVGKDATGKPILEEVFPPKESGTPVLRRVSWREIF